MRRNNSDDRKPGNQPQPAPKVRSLESLSDDQLRQVGGGAGGTLARPRAC